MIWGMLPVDKPSGMSSAVVVKKIRDLTGIRRIGHAGTLDPAAEGVLVLGLNRATVLLPYLPTIKTYLATVRLGIATDTYDAQGRVLSQCLVPELTVAQIEKVLHQFVGVLPQVPPPFSALHYHGQRLYRLARQGKTLALSPRPVFIQAMQFKHYHSPDIEFEVSCAAGTYVRSLAMDIGKALGCPAHLYRLIRTVCGGFSLAQCLSLEALTALLSAPGWEQCLIPPSQALSHLPVVSIGLLEQAKIQHGQAILWPSSLDPEENGRPVRIQDAAGHLLAIGRQVGDKLVMEKVFLPGG